MEKLEEMGLLEKIEEHLNALGRCHRCARFDQFRVERRRLPDRDRQYGLETVYDVACDDKRNAKPALLDGDALHRVDDVHVDLVQRRTNAAGLDCFTKIIRQVTARRIGLSHLADFFFQCHLLDQRTDALVDRQLRGVRGKGYIHDDTQAAQRGE